MTALDAYDRLEAVGFLKKSFDGSKTEVVVTFGEATLTMNALSDAGDTPLTHWSLAAVDLVSETEEKAIYCLNAMTEETLEIEDSTLRDALAKVLQDRALRVNPQRRSRTPFWLAMAALVVGAGYFLLPRFVERTAMGMISPERAEILTSEMMPMIRDRTGPACDTPMATVGLERLAERLNPGGQTTFAIHDLGDGDVISLPGGTVLISQNMLENAENNNEISGWAAIGIASVIETPVIAELFQGQGILDGLRFLALGKLTKAAKERAVNRMLVHSSPVSDQVVENARQLMVNAKLSTDGLARISGQHNMPNSIETAEPVMTEDEWSALKNVCQG